MGRAENAVTAEVRHWLRLHGYSELTDANRAQVAKLVECGTRDVAGIFWRANTGGARYGGDDIETARQKVIDGKRPSKRRHVKFGIGGQPDIQGFTRDGLFFGIETKAKTKQSSKQIEFERIMKACGACYIVARSSDDLERSPINQRRHPERTKR